MQNDLSHLPTTAQKLIDVIGVPLALRLVEACGGHTINMYNSDSSLEKMAVIVGREAAEKLFKFYGKCAIHRAALTSRAQTGAQ